MELAPDGLIVMIDGNDGSAWLPAAEWGVREARYLRIIAALRARVRRRDELMRALTQRLERIERRRSPP